LRMFEADDLRLLIDIANPALKAMILLGINCGFGNTDCSRLPLPAVNLEEGWINFPRPKTAIMRRCPLWPETIDALRVAITERPKSKQSEFDELVFITKYGAPFVRNGSNGVVIDGVSAQFSKLLVVLKINRPGLGFYAIRHTFETIGGASRDQIAVSAIMGHAPAASDMSAVYRERIDDDRLVAVTDHIHNWLWNNPEKKPAKRSAKNSNT